MPEAPHLALVAQSNQIISILSRSSSPTSPAAAMPSSPVHTADEKPPVPQHPPSQIPGWHPAQHHHLPQLDTLQQHAAQYGHGHGHPPVGAPPFVHRGSSDGIVSPTSTSHNQRVPIEREKRGSLPTSSIGSPVEPQSGADQAMTAPQSGPMSSSVTVPARPRPGRKPIAQEDAADRRRLQNRIAQRNFRDKRQQKLHETIQELEENKQEYQNSVAALNRRLDESRMAYRDLEQRFEQRVNELIAQNQAVLERIESTERRNQDLEKRNQDVEKQLKGQQQQLPSLGSFRPSDPSTAQVYSQMKDVSTPPRSENDVEMAMETDFTTQGPTYQSSYGLRQTTTNDSNNMDYSVQAEDPCGFCTDLQNCACAQEKAAEMVEKPAPVSVPGSCDQCRADPVRAQACRDMAASTEIAPRPPTSAGAHTNRTNSSMPPPPRRTCASMVDSFNKYGERTSSIATLFGGARLNTYPAPNGGGYMFEETQAAEVLSNLSRRSEIRSEVAESPKSVAE